MDKYKNKKIAILGYGFEGKSLTDFLLKLSPSKLVIFDEKNENLEQEHQEKEVTIKRGSFIDLDLSDFDFVFRSPGVKIEKVNCAQDKITSLVNLFFEYKKGKSIIVTGTKGKSTTVLLIEQILKQNGKKVFVGGNIKLNPLNFIGQLDRESYSVLEMSSFQLQDFKGVSDYAVILPLFPDHLDYHNNVDGYYKSKSKAFSNSDQTIVIISEENMTVLDLEKFANKIIIFSSNKSDALCYEDRDSIICDDKVIAEKASDFCEFHKIPIIDFVAATAFAFAEGLKINIEELKKNFKKLPFRIELVQQKSGVKFFNDSASTNPVSTIVAIDQMRRPTALLLGGSSKGLNFENLTDEIIKKRIISSVYLFGESRAHIEESLRAKKYQGTIKSFASLRQVIENLDLGKVENVLFSPAFASFDQYENYTERANEFNELVKNL